MDNFFSQTLNDIATAPRLRNSQLYILSKMDKAALTIFTDTWATIAPPRRQDIARELVAIAETNFEVDFSQVFMVALGDADPEIRVLAINGLWEHDTPDTLKTLIAILNEDPAISVRAAAANGLGRFIFWGEMEELPPRYAQQAYQALYSTIYNASTDVEVRRRAVEGIAFSSEPAVIPIIEAAYYDDNEHMQISAVFAMGRNADARWIPQVVTELDNPLAEIRFEAARAAGELEAADAVPGLVQLLEVDPDPEIQEMAMWSLGQIGGPMAQEALEAHLDHPNEALAMAAEEALEELTLLRGWSDFDLLDFNRLYID